MRFVLLAFLGLAGCGNRARPLDEEFRDAVALRRAERFDLALAKADASLGRAEGIGDIRAAWRFRILKADIVLGHREVNQALLLLNRYGEPPTGPDWAE